MRQQAVTTVIACICLVIAPAARAGDAASETNGTIARALRLIDAKDYTSATTLLEDLLLEAKPKERATILAILRRSYEVMAREAQAAGRDREAAHYRDNAAILGAAKMAPEPAGPTKPRTQAPLGPKPLVEKIADAVERAKDRPLPSEPKTLIRARIRTRSFLRRQSRRPIPSPPLSPNPNKTRARPWVRGRIAPLRRARLRGRLHFCHSGMTPFGWPMVLPMASPRRPPGRRLVPQPRPRVPGPHDLPATNGPRPYPRSRTPIDFSRPNSTTRQDNAILPWLAKNGYRPSAPTTGPTVVWWA